jgi:hypothetical protein
MNLFSKNKQQAVSASSLFLVILFLGLFLGEIEARACTCRANFYAVYVTTGVCTENGCNGYNACQGGGPEEACQEDGGPVDIASVATITNTTSQTNTATVATVVNDSGGNSNALATINKSGSSSSGQQNISFKNAADTLMAGANNRATVALVECASGANQELNNPNSGIGEIAGCQDDFAKADQMAGMAAKTGKNPDLAPDSEVIGTDIAQSTLSTFQKNFGVGQDEYIARMLAAHGRPMEFSEILKSKFSNDKFEQMMAAAETTKSNLPDEKTSGVSAAVPELAKKKVDTSLRDSLKAKLAQSSSRSPASMQKIQAAADTSKPFQATNLQPGTELDTIVNGPRETESQDLSVFEIIHNKLREFTARQHL